MKVTKLLIAALITTTTALMHHECFHFQGHKEDKLTIHNEADVPAGVLVYSVNRRTGYYGPFFHSQVLSYTEKKLLSEDWKDLGLCTQKLLDQEVCKGPVGAVYGDEKYLKLTNHTSFVIPVGGSSTVELEGPTDMSRVCALVYQPSPKKSLTPPFSFTEQHKHGNLSLANRLKFKWTMLEFVVVLATLVVYLFRGLKINDMLPWWRQEAHTLEGLMLIMNAASTLAFDAVKIGAFWYYNSQERRMSPAAELLFFGQCNALDLLWQQILLFSFCLKERALPAHKWSLENRGVERYVVYKPYWLIAGVPLFATNFILQLCKYKLSYHTFTSCMLDSGVLVRVLLMINNSGFMLRGFFSHYEDPLTQRVDFRSTDHDQLRVFAEKYEFTMRAFLIPAISLLICSRFSAWFIAMAAMEDTSATEDHWSVFVMPVQWAELFSPSKIYTTHGPVLLYCGTACWVVPLLLFHFFLDSHTYVRLKRLMIEGQDPEFDTYYRIPV